ncbi:MAG: phosphate acyltransferase PlsX [Acetilactobacillus jinshanensis]
MKIAVDALGGDYAPAEIVKGVEHARDKYSDVEFLLYGPVDQIKPLIKNFNRIKLIQADQFIKMGDQPVRSVLTKRHSSMDMAARAVKDGKADAFLSAGNSGAILASGLFIVGRIKGIARPAFTVALPTVKGDHDRFVMLDVGANAESKPFNLYQYAFMGKYYAQKVLHIDNPRIGLMNNGTEADKGDSLHKTDYQLLSKTKDLNFIGNIESRELLNDVADVVIADGFSGNAVLKGMEGTALSLLYFIKHSILKSGIGAKLGALMLKPTFKKIADKLDYSKYGGAVLLGVNAPYVKMHGNTKAPVVVNTVGQIRTMIKSHTTNNIVNYFDAHSKEMSDIKKRAQNY